MTEQTDALAAIEKHRVRIDEIDDELVALLNERAACSLAIRALKPAAGMTLYDPAREGRIFERITACSDGTLYDEGLHEIYETLLRVMKENPTA